MQWKEFAVIQPWASNEAARGRQLWTGSGNLYKLSSRSLTAIPQKQQVLGAQRIPECFGKGSLWCFLASSFPHFPGIKFPSPSGHTFLILVTPPSPPPQAWSVQLPEGRASCGSLLCPRGPHSVQRELLHRKCLWNESQIKLSETELTKEMAAIWGRRFWYWMHIKAV